MDNRFFVDIWEDHEGVLAGVEGKINYQCNSANSEAAIGRRPSAVSSDSGSDSDSDSEKS